MTTDAPCAANSFAMPAPIPFDAPVTTATFPFSFPFFICVPFVVLPGKWLAKMEEPAVRAVIGEGSKMRTRLSALANFHRLDGPAHLSLYPAGMRGVHFDFVVAQFVG